MRAGQGFSIPCVWKTQCVHNKQHCKTLYIINAQKLPNVSFLAYDTKCCIIAVVSLHLLFSIWLFIEPMNSGFQDPHWQVLGTRLSHMHGGTEIMLLFKGMGVPDRSPQSAMQYRRQGRCLALTSLFSLGGKSLEWKLFSVWCRKYNRDRVV